MTELPRPTAASVLASHDLTGRTVVITGASAGMGLASAVALAAAGARVGLVGRNPEALAAATREVAARASGAEPFGIELDLASLASVRSGADEILSQAPQIDVLMNNAGVMFTPFGHTIDGNETQFGVCHLGHFLLTQQLQPALLAAAAQAGEARVVILTSAGHAMSDIDLTDPNWQTREYDKFAAYGAAKTANLLHMVELERRWAEHGVHSYAVHPGTVATNLARHMTREDFSTMFNYGRDDEAPSAPRPRAHIATPEEGASTQVWAAVAPELAGHGGSYLADRAISHDARPYALDPDRAQQLWALSERLIAVGA